MSRNLVSAPWAQSSAEVLKSLSSDPYAGLSEAVAAERLEEFGPNEIEEKAGVSPFKLFVMQFANFMIALLFAAAVVSAFIGEWIDAGLILVIVLANAIIGFLQELRAEKAVSALRQMSHPIARVRRDGSLREIDRVELVPGDVIEFRGGDLLPADARLIEAHELEVGEAALTGESLPVEKRTDAIGAEASLPDRNNMVYAGTSVMRGRGVAVVTSTAMSTEIGKIAGLLHSAEDTLTPLQVQLASLSKQIAFVVLLICAIVFAIGIFREAADDWDRQLVGEMLLIAVSLAVAAIPEGLPAVITVALAIGSQRMSERKAIVRRLAAVETLGSVNVICTDKTGTLTQNRMSVQEVFASGDSGEAEHTSLRFGSLCSDVEVTPTGELIGSATESAIVRAAIDRQIDVRAERAQSPRLAEIPFTSDRKRMSTLHKIGDGYALIVKGAAEAILERCEFHGTVDSPQPMPDGERERWEELIDGLTSRGTRVLAIAARSWPADHLYDRNTDPESELVLQGIVALVDPIRPEARDAIAKCRDAGIVAVMITGDHQSTAAAIADELTLSDSGREVMTGGELERIGDEELRERVESIGVYARVSPEHKLRIVRAWQSRDAIVAMTGDGVNDAPALKQADIGVAMGVAGTEVARGASDMILADDNFASIVAAVEEGRVVFDNIRKFVAYLLTANTSEVLLLTLGIVLGLPLPLLPVHILWVNLVTDGPPAIALGFEPVEPDAMRHRPRGRGEGVINREVMGTILAVGVLMACVCLAIFYFYLPGEEDSNREMQIAYARTMAFVTISLSQLFFVLGIRSHLLSLFSPRLPSNHRLTLAVLLGLVLQLAVVYIPVVAKIFETVPLSLRDLGICALASTSGLWAMEFKKRFQN